MIDGGGDSELVGHKIFGHAGADTKNEGKE